MPSATFFNTIKSRLLSPPSPIPPIGIEFVQMWNNQLESLKGADTEANMIYSFSLPALFVEFLNLETEQLGNGNQVYAGLIVRIHILHRQEDAGDGTLEQNLAMLEYRDAVQMALQNFRPAGASEFIRLKQEMDYNHNNIYHYIIDYGCTYIDTITSEPVYGQTTTNPITPDIESSYNPHPYIKP